MGPEDQGGEHLIAHDDKHPGRHLDQRVVTPVPEQE
jgi:hypothetical protein